MRRTRGKITAYTCTLLTFAALVDATGSTQVCYAEEAGTSQAYVKKDGWPGTMTASRAALVSFLAEHEPAWRRVKLGPWYATGPIRTESFSDALFPEQAVNFEAKGDDGELLWREHVEWRDGEVHHLSGDFPASTYLFRVLTAERPVSLTAGLGSNDGLEVWLNGRKLLSRDVGRRAAPDQDRVTLDLAAGENRLLMKVFNRAAACEFYFSLLPNFAGQLWEQIRKDFPVQAGWMRWDLPRGEHLTWFKSGDKTELEQKMIERCLVRGLGSADENFKKEFEALRESGAPASDPSWLRLYERICEKKRGAMVKRCPPIAFIKRTCHARKGTNGTMLGQINPNAEMGSSICIYDPAHPERGDNAIFESKEGFIFDMSVSYDARKLLFSFMDNVKANIKEKKDSFHIWEVNVDGTGLRQLTTGPFHDASAVYLPDDRIVFCSTRVQSFSLCQDFLAAAMYVMDGAGGNVRRIEYNTLCNTTPHVMDDGLILFTRWEYQDKNIFCVQGLWTINPAGQRLQLFHGNTLTIPNSVCNAKQIPGTRKIVCTMAPHHGRPLGAIAIIDRSLGFESPESIVNITPEIPYQPRVGEAWNYGVNNSWGPGDRQYAWSYGDPYPIAEDLFLIAYGGPMEGGPERYRLFLLDERGNKVCLYEDPVTSCFNPVPLRSRPLPHKIPGAVAEPSGEGTFFVADIYRGLLDKGVKRGQIKRLRIMSQIPKKYNTEGPRYHDHYPVIGQGSYYAKYCYGTVPVYEDGTAYFKAPAGVELYFIALDADGKEIRRMGTVTQITAGERQGCVGCHESRFTAAPGNPDVMKRVAGVPDTITPPPWGAGPVSFVKQVQPVLDRYCVSCHSGRAPKARVDLSGDKTRFYNMAYRSLVDRNLVEYYYIHDAPTGNFPPLESGSCVSKLTKIIESEHSGVKMDDESRRRIFSWIDSNVPYYDRWDMSRPYTTGGRDTWYRVVEGKENSAKRSPELWYADFEKIYKPRCSSCHGLQLSWVNLTNPENSRVLNAHLAKDAGGLGLNKENDGKKPLMFESTDDAVYQEMLKAIQAGEQALYARPRMDMPGAVAIPQQRDFGKLY